ncbi:MAG: class II aldolase/adducin family protein [Gammaproteobacteria bacterium]
MSAELRARIVELARRLGPGGLSQGKTGNLSCRDGGGFLITPTGVRYEVLTPAMIVAMDMEGAAAAGALVPSSEWRFHRDIYLARPDIGAIVHVHSPYATALACANRSIPAFHYMVAVAGGDSIPLAPYATFGTQALSDHVVRALRERLACLLANHGMIAAGADLDAAFERAEAIEELARHYWLALQAGTPVVLGEAQMQDVLERFKTYGKQ